MLKLAELKMHLAAHGIRPHKRMGQNFLLDPNLLRAIARDAEIDEADCVLEIGTGCGALTLSLCEQAGLVVTVELDRGMFSVASDVLAQATNLVMIEADALGPAGGLNPELTGLLHAYTEHGLFNVEESEFSRTHVQLGKLRKPPRLGRLKCVSNLPYSAAGAILMGLLESPLAFERLVVMVQYEVGEKICSGPGQRTWGILSLLVSRFAKSRILRRIPSRVFWPQPKVDSALVELTPHERPDMQAYERLRRLVHLFFLHRRKRGVNALALALGCGATLAEGWLEQAGIDPSDRADALEPEALQRLADLPDVASAAQARMGTHPDQLADRAARQARRAQWKRQHRDEEE